MPLRFLPPIVTKHNKPCVCVRLMEIPLLKWNGFYLDVPFLTLLTYLFVRSVQAKQTWRATSPYFNRPHSTTFCSVSAPTLVVLPVQSFNLLHLFRRLQVCSLSLLIFIILLLLLRILIYLWILSGASGSSVMIGFVIGVLLTLAVFVLKRICNR